MLVPASRLGIAGFLALTAATLGCLGAAASAAARTGQPRFAVPAAADQMVIVSSPTYEPPGNLAAFRAYQRATPHSRWRAVFGPWEAEIGYRGLRDARHEGDGSTPTGLFGIGATVYGNRPDPGGLHYAYQRLVCGDWWDEDPYSASYNRFVHIPCGVRPAFADGSEPLWTETIAYPYLAVIRFNVNPTRTGRNAPGSGIFLHSWVGAPTNGCVALPERRLVAILQWLKPNAHPVIAIGTKREVGTLPNP